ncbi:MAG: alanine racemase, partial [Desulfobacula sp.]|nr:alanine racemase [Desulfobacula sp.]
LKSIVTAVREVPKGFCVSYGMTHKTRKKTRLASVPVGYADGFSRRFSSNGTLLVKGHRAPVVGRICMDQTMIDVGDIPDVSPGDEVVLIGSQGDETLGADELAERINTINYEIVSALTPRVKRIYSDSGSG